MSCHCCPTSMNLDEFRILCEDEPIPKRQRVQSIRFRSSVVCILFFIRCKSLIRRKWLKELGLRKPKSFHRSFASHPKSEFWNYRLNHWVRPRDVAKCCNKKFAFDCTTCGHTFASSLNSVVQNHWCGFCSGHKLCSDDDCASCFQRSFASHLRSKHWSRRNGCRPRDVAKNSNTKYWFDCATCGHEYQTVLSEVSSRGAGCPYCARAKLCDDEDCDMCMGNSFASHEKAQFWNCSLNRFVRPRDVSIRSSKKFWFTCGACHHEFQMRIENIAHPTNPTWCAYCSKTHCQLCDDADCEHCFNRSFASTPIQSWAEWHPDNTGSPRDFSKNSDKKKRFLCLVCGDDHPEGFLDSLTHITSGRRCPFCSNHRLCDRPNCATCTPKTIKGNARMMAWYDRDANPPAHLVSLQSNRSNWWICVEGHRWKSKTYNVYLGRGCPECKHKSEQKCREFLWKTFGKSDIKSGRVEWCINPTTGKKLPFDMIVASKRTICECDGEQHIRPVPFFNKTMTFEEIWARDRYKEQRALANGYSVIRVRAKDVYYDKNDWKQRLLDALSNIDVENPSVDKLY